MSECALILFKRYVGYRKRRAWIEKLEIEVDDYHGMERNVRVKESVLAVLKEDKGKFCTEYRYLLLLQ